jgi:hypothetical protein
MEANQDALDHGMARFLDDLAHETGHVLLGGGHPDDPLRSKGGVAWLFGTAHHKRLMRSGRLQHPDAGHLLVKAEWDKAENWLKGNVDTPVSND